MTLSVTAAGLHFVYLHVRELDECDAFWIAWPVQTDLRIFVTLKRFFLTKTKSDLDNKSDLSVKARSVDFNSYLTSAKVWN